MSEEIEFRKDLVIEKFKDGKIAIREYSDPYDYSDSFIIFENKEEIKKFIEFISKVIGKD